MTLSSISRPLSDVVEIDAEHIRCQMADIPVMGFTATGLENAMTGLKSNSAEDNPFTLSYEESFGSAATANSFTVVAPDNLRSLLFGQEVFLMCSGASGSLTDTMPFCTITAARITV